MKNLKHINALGALMSIIALSLSTYLYGWQLTVILLLAFWGNNLEQK